MSTVQGGISRDNWLRKDLKFTQDFEQDEGSIPSSSTEIEDLKNLRLVSILLGLSFYIPMIESYQCPGSSTGKSAYLLSLRCGFKPHSGHTIYIRT